MTDNPNAWKPPEPNLTLFNVPVYLDERVPRDMVIMAEGTLDQMRAFMELPRVHVAVVRGDEAQATATGQGLAPIVKTDSHFEGPDTGIAVLDDVLAPRLREWAVSMIRTITPNIVAGAVTWLGANNLDWLADSELLQGLVYAGFAAAWYGLMRAVELVARSPKLRTIAGRLLGAARPPLLRSGQ